MIYKILGLVLMAPLLIILVAASMYHQQHLPVKDALESASLMVAMFEAFGLGLYFFFK